MSYEHYYHLGRQSVYRKLLMDAIVELRLPNDTMQWEIERSEAVAKLREVCRVYGDNDWPDTLNLADVIDKHLARHL